MPEVRVEIYEIGRTDGGALILLQGKEEMTEKMIPIQCNFMQGRSIKSGLSGVTSSRPHTHDLFTDLLNEYGCALDRIVVDEIEEAVYSSKVYISKYDNGEKRDIVLEARPSDAIAVAARLRAPIFVDRDLMEDKGVSPSEFEIRES